MNQNIFVNVVDPIVNDTLLWIMNYVALVELA